MKKLLLNVDDLEVQSFATLRAPEPWGTVLGAQEGLTEITCESGCGCPTQEQTCDYTCGYTCDDSCGSCYESECGGCYTMSGCTCDGWCLSFHYSPC